MKKWDKFFKENDITYGSKDSKDMWSVPPVYYNSMHEGFLNFFITFNEINWKYDAYIYGLGWKRSEKAFGFCSPKSLTFTILGFHRFIELYIKDILNDIDPYLAVKFFKQKADVISYLRNKLPPSEMESIEFDEAWKRLKELRVMVDTEENDIIIDKAKSLKHKFEFLFSHEEAINKLRYWRNTIMHNGKHLPNLFALDYLITQHIIPIVKEILLTNTDKIEKWYPNYLLTLTGINILDEFDKIKIDLREYEKGSEELKINLVKIGMLKAYGLACFNTHRNLKINNQSSFEYNYKDVIGRAKRFALAEKQHEHFKEIKSCPCCGESTLVLYFQLLSIPGYFENEKIYWATCYLCQYHLRYNVGDPYDFGLSNEKLFPSNQE